MGNRVVSQAIPKVDYKALVTGKAVYTDDLAAKDSLVVKVLRSPYAHALIEDINLTRAELVPDIECILTYKDCPDKRFTMAGQTYPEPSPYDRLILDQRVRFVGDAVAIVAGRTKEAVNKALKLIKVKYEVLEPVLDFHKAKDNPILVHPEENWKSLCPVGADNKRNLCAHDSCEEGDIEAVLANCEYIIDQVYHTKANQQAMMETFRTYTYLDTYGRLNVLSSTQVPFHVRRILANALDIPKSKIRVIKPRIGGGFGAKQSVVSDAGSEGNTENSALDLPLETPIPQKIFVDVCGAVVNPGVYELDEGVRIFQAVDAGGGYLPEAAINYLNRARSIGDGQQIYVPTEKEVAENLELAMAKVPEALNDGDNSGNLGLEEIQGSSVENPSGTVGRDTGSFGDGVGDDTRINLNTADAGQLSTLSGIGQSKAEAIVAYREEHGDFASIEEIMNVEGIKEGTFSKIKDKISTG